MATKQEFALLSLYVYDIKTGGIAVNRPNLPSGWEEVEYKPDDKIGFSYGVFRNAATNEVVVAYTGTNEGIDWVTNVFAGSGLSSLQINSAAAVAAKAIQTYGAANVSFTGHSLGAGLASVMAVWFDQSATVFDVAPFAATAINALAVDAARLWILSSAGISNSELNGFAPTVNFTTRESKVHGYYLEGEALEALRLVTPSVYGVNDKVPAGIGDYLGPMESVALHSQALLATFLISENLRTATLQLPRLIPRLLDTSLYQNSAATSPDRNFLVDIIRSDQTNPGNGKLTHFANDLQILGTNVAGLNKAAQDALIAQGIEWYYWQGTDYVGQQFFAATGDLLQYTTAVGAGLGGAQNKAFIYVDKWLTPLFNANNEFGGNVNYFQWNVVAGADGATAASKDATKTQIFIGNAGADIFTGGNLNDALFGSGGDDRLNGGGGNDKLLGGADADIYLFSGAFGSDTITDSDGNGSIVVGTAPPYPVARRSQTTFGNLTTNSRSSPRSAASWSSSSTPMRPTTP